MIIQLSMMVSIKAGLIFGQKLVFDKKQNIARSQFEFENLNSKEQPLT